MSIERTTFDPQNPNSNIHGMVRQDGNSTCLTKDGKTRCTGCCYALSIMVQGKLEKEAGDMCPAQLPKKGCAHIVDGQPEKRFDLICNGFHCSSQIQKLSVNPNDLATKQRITMCNVASNAVGEITNEEMEENLKRLRL